jgi:UDP-N-acetylmuramoyl-L-alanyl-D-glutamate--2,6-diaminopimelate ligase
MTARAHSRASRAATLGALAEIDPAWRLTGDPKTRITGLTTNSKSVSRGDLFIALPGGYFDGHDYAASALKAGAAAVIVERPLDLGCPEIVVADARAALAPLAAEFYDHPSRKLTVVGITGTDGKTTTSYLLNAIARDAGMRTGMIGTIAVIIDNQTVADETRQTTPESLDVQRHLAAMVEAGVDVAIIEATSHGLDLHRLDAVRFAIGGVTNITHEHLEHHKTIAAYRRAKAKLFERVGEIGGAAVINLDDEGAAEMIPYAHGASVLTYRLDARADLYAEAIDLRVDGSRFDLVVGNERRSVTLPLLGDYNVANALCAAGLALSLGIGLDQIVESLGRAPAIPGRMERIDAGQQFGVIVDYAHTPDSLSKVLTLLRSLNPGGRLIVVTGSAGERDIAKRALQGAVCADLADYSLFTTEDPRCEDPDAIIAEIAAGAASRGSVEGRDFVCITDRMSAIREAIGRAQPGDIVLLAGKGHELSIIWGLEKRPWDEAAAARQALEELSTGG